MTGETFQISGEKINQSISDVEIMASYTENN